MKLFKLSLNEKYYTAIPHRSFGKLFHLSLSKENLHFLWRFLRKLKQCPDANVLHVEVTPYDSIQEQILTPSDLSVFCYIV